MAKKYYAVRNGRDGVSGVYLSWEDCQARIKGAKGVSYKGFATREEAEAFLRGGLPGGKQDPPLMPFRDDAAVAYVDGSYRADTGEFGGGAVLFWQGEKTEFSRKNDDADMAQMHNVAGEIMGAVLVIRHCAAQKIPAVEIHHDYEGVAKWATGQWKANKPGTQAYAQFCARARQRMKITFVKVKGHSGDTWNDEADRLARKALGI